MLAERKEVIKEVWKRNFASVMNEGTEGRAEVTTRMEVKINVVPPYPQRKVVRDKTEEAIKMFYK